MGFVCVAVLIVCFATFYSEAQVANPYSEKKVVCYYGSWSYKRAAPYDFTPDKIDPFVCTHIIYAFCGISKTENVLVPIDSEFDLDKKGYAKVTGLKMKNKNLKVMLVVGGWVVGSETFARVAANETNRREFAVSAVRYLRGFKFDGLDLNWQHPTFREGGTPEDKQNYVLLAQTLKEEFDKDAAERNKPRLLLSIAIHHSQKFLPVYDIANFNIYVDFINVIAYDYAFAYTEVLNHHSPLYSLEDDPSFGYDSKINVNYTVHYFLEYADAHKLVMGIPLYGRTHKLESPEETALGSGADGAGDAGPYTGEKGFFAYFEICNQTKNNNWKVVQTKPGYAGPYAYKDDQWVSYDDIEMIKNKAAYALKEGLGGIMFWTMDYDDFVGDCRESEDSRFSKFPLIRAARKVMDASDQMVFDDGRDDSKRPWMTNKPPPAPTTELIPFVETDPAPPQPPEPSWSFPRPTPPPRPSFPPTHSSKRPFLLPDSYYATKKRPTFDSPKYSKVSADSILHLGVGESHHSRFREINSSFFSSFRRIVARGPTYYPRTTPPPLPAYNPQPEAYPGEASSHETNIISDLIQLIERAGSMKKFCSILKQAKAVSKSQFIHKIDHNQDPGGEESLVFETPKLPPILMVLSNSSIYIKEVNIYQKS